MTETIDTDTLRAGLRADCASCVGLCCVGLALTRSADFPVDKPAGTPCLNLAADDTCRIHDRLRGEGWRGCTVYDCLGAGQQVTQVSFGGASWRDDDGVGRAMFAALPRMRELHELLWYLADALDRPDAASLRAELARAVAETRAVTMLDGEALLAYDVAPHAARVRALLGRASELVRATAGEPSRARVRAERRGRDLLGAQLAGARLAGALLRGTLLVAADLRGADLRLADLAGADLRDTDLRGADLSGTLYLTQPQLDAAHGDASTRLPSTVQRPGHWT
ncbi:pentapeptide repeat protein [Beutenbergia cavernae DSM 12333]|uniref:Pentapeptide repeat protein n=1 Tax=Beutenbergia cavernae (strain ATCC BAA-8 / DSM 12333 / CCUG 43141 / JCM 11478 / NBRC 16432 / NCIMB 13614 / HKI 0122) TaxID=471853 RepID=C5C3S4_BEUC1|nr:pentapeptide repeat-containing protein [Beutenbergia cavernae]ACQ81983.1 pentapeptide repeat protein [Beutenbergia cavernae DSM 12333]